MSTFKRIAIDGFRRLNNIDLQMRPMMVMIGANGVGKTSFMEALSLLCASAHGSLNRSLNGMGGVSDMLTYGQSAAITISVKVEVPDDEPLEYALQIGIQGSGYLISQEALTQARKGNPDPFKYIESIYGDIHYHDIERRGLVKPDWEYDTLESALSQVPRMCRKSEMLRRTLGSIAQYHAPDLSQHSPVKLPQKLRPTATPGEYGEDLVPFLYNLREARSGTYELIDESLRSVFSGYESLGFVVRSDGMVSMTWKDKGFRKPFYMRQLSDGTIRFLWLMSLLHTPGLPKITMIDRPESGLHPELLGITSEIMREAALRTQLIVATYSSRLMRFLQPDEVVAMDICEDGGATMTWADSLELDGWLRHFHLDEVWQMGRMGARS